jgi:hypothetical protein
MQENIREHSTKKVTYEAINAGSLQRIADAVEKVAINHIQLEQQCAELKRQKEYWRAKAETLQRSVNAYKGLVKKKK